MGTILKGYKKWGTPQALFDKLNGEFQFTLDACATQETAKCDTYYDEGALEKDWPGIVFCNPPYGREIGRWVKKGFDEANKGALVVMLLPARTDTVSWWHPYVMKASEVRLIKGRLIFEFMGTPYGSAPFPSCIVVFTDCGLGTVWSSYDR